MYMLYLYTCCVCVWLRGLGGLCKQALNFVCEILSVARALMSMTQLCDCMADFDEVEALLGKQKAYGWKKAFKDVLRDDPWYMQKLDKLRKYYEVCSSVQQKYQGLTVKYTKWDEAVDVSGEGLASLVSDFVEVKVLMVHHDFQQVGESLFGYAAKLLKTAIQMSDILVLQRLQKVLKSLQEALPVMRAVCAQSLVELESSLTVTDGAARLGRLRTAGQAFIDAAAIVPIDGDVVKELRNALWPRKGWPRMRRLTPNRWEQFARSRSRCWWTRGAWLYETRFGRLLNR